MTRNQERSLAMAMILLIVVIVAMALSGCGASYHLKRAKVHLLKAEAKGARVNADTIWQTLEIPVPYVSTDTVFQSLEGDTIYLEKDRLKIKYVNLPADSVYIFGECEADTIYFDNPTTVYREISSGYTLWDMIVLGIFLVAVSVLIGMLIQGMRK